MSAIRELLDLLDNEYGLTGACKDEPDEGCVGWDGSGQDLPITFGHLRRPRAELDGMEAKDA